MSVSKKLNRLKLIDFIKVIGLDSLKEILIVNGKLSSSEQFKNNDDFEVIDLKDCIIAPGFIDPQVNGYGSCDFWTIKNLETEKGFLIIDELRYELALSGVVAFCPTIITAKTSDVIESINYINAYIEHSKPNTGAKILGVHIEGVFITKYGVHESKYAQKELTVEKVKPFLKDNVVLFTLAPELDKTGEAIKFLQKNNILVSIGHSNATYAEGKRAIEKYDLRTVTHMFNALRGIDGFSHRGTDRENLNILESKLTSGKIDPEKDGIILALLNDKNILCMIIADGIHVSKEIVQFLYQSKGRNLFSLSSDTVATDFFNSIKTKGILGGGQSKIDKCVSNLINWKVSGTEESLLSASKPIAGQLKTAQELGLGEVVIGKEANIVIWDTKKNAVKGTIMGENVFLNI